MGQDTFQTGTIRLIGETKALRKRVRRSRGESQLFGGFLSGVRRVFALLLVATVFVFVFSYSTDLQNMIVSNLYKWSQAELKSNPLRQSALNHENEVNQAAK